MYIYVINCIYIYIYIYMCVYNSLYIAHYLFSFNSIKQYNPFYLVEIKLKLFNKGLKNKKGKHKSK